MLIQITKTPSKSSHKLPPQLAKLGNDEIVLIELQGSLEVEGVQDGQLVGTLKIDPKTVRILYSFVTKYMILRCTHFRTKQHCL
jgi:hypothetical protein